MPQVPYQPYPTVAPSQEKTPEIQPRVIPEAFGVGIGHALGQLGGALEKGGDQLFRTALHLQDMQNRTDANNAALDFAEATSQKRTEFLTREGVNAGPVALEAHQAELRGIRDQFRAKLKTPMAQQLYDTESRGYLERTFTAAAVHAASQTRKAYHDSIKTGITSIEADMASNPEDVAGWEDGVRRGEARIRELSRSTGEAPGVADLQVKAWREEQMARRAISLADQDPYAARTFMDENKGSFGKHEPQVYRAVQDKGDHLIARRVAEKAVEDMYAPDFDYRKAPTLEERQKQVREQVEKDTNGNKEAVELSVQYVNNYYNRWMTGHHNQQLVDRNELNTAALGEGLMTKPITLEDLFKQKPELKTLYDRAEPSVKNSIQSQLTKNSKNDVTWDPEGKRLTRYQEIYGMAKDPAQWGKFKDLNLLDEDLPRKEVLGLIKMQAAARVRPADDPRVGRALGYLNTEMDAIGATKTKSERKYNQFRGMLQMAIEDFTAGNNGKGPTEKQIREEIGPALVREIETPGFFWGTNKVPIYQWEPPASLIEKAKEDPTFKGQPDWYIAEELRRAAYQRLIELGRSRTESK